MREHFPNRIAKVIIPLCALAVLAACPSRDVSSVDPETGRETRTNIDISLERKLDLLFVIDESIAMEAIQEQLADNFPLFMDELASIEGGLPDLNIGVISVDVGADPSPAADPAVGCEGDGKDGRLIVGEDDSGCPGLDGQWIEARQTGDGVEFNFDDSEELDDVFSCMASLGAEGCGFEMPLEALARSFEHPNNEGFFREDAHLGVVILTMEDDCSAHDMDMFAGDPFGDLESERGPLASFRCTDYGITCDDDVQCDLDRNMRCEGVRESCEPNYDSPYMYPPEHYVDIVRQFKGGDDSRIIVAGIWGDMGPIEIAQEPANQTEYARSLPTCELSHPDADPPEFPEERDVYPPNAPVRLEVFRSAFQNTQTQSICEESLVDPIRNIAAEFVVVLGTPCVQGNLLDTEPDEPGVQPECSVSDVRNPGQDDEEEFIIPECDDDHTNTPCWTMEPSDDCNTPSGLQLEVDRDGDSPPSNTEIRIRCVGA